MNHVFVVCQEADDSIAFVSVSEEKACQCYALVADTIHKASLPVTPGNVSGNETVKADYHKPEGDENDKIECGVFYNQRDKHGGITISVEEADDVIGEVD
jgi:hypothetical protein